MNKPLIKMIKINNMQFNPNRDPQVHRRTVRENFRIQVVLDAADHNGGDAHCTLHDENNRVLVEKTVTVPGTFDHELSFATPGVRLITLSVAGNGQQSSRDIRLDVLEHAWVG
jgi:hypothetical protein